MQSTTPTGSPPTHPQSLSGQMQSFPQYQQLPQPQPPQQPPVPSASSTASILQALANMAKQNQNVTPPAPQAPAPPVAASQYNVSNSHSNGLSGLSQDAGALVMSRPTAPPAQVTPAPMPYNSTPPNANNVPGISMFGNQMPGMYLGQQQPPQVQNSYPQFPPQQPQQGPGVPPVDQMALLQLILQHPGLQGMSVPQLTASFNSIGADGPNGPGTTLGGIIPAWQQMSQMMGVPQQPPQNVSEAPRGDDGYNRGGQRGREHYSPPSRSPPRYREGRRGRSRSRSPPRFERGGGGVGSAAAGHSPPNFRRRSPVYGEYEGNEIRGGRDGERNRGGRGRGGAFGRRGGSSPRGRRDRSRTPPGRFPNANGKGSQVVDRGTPTILPRIPKFVEFDQSIGSGSIKGKPKTVY